MSVNRDRLCAVPVMEIMSLLAGLYLCVWTVDAADRQGEDWPRFLGPRADNTSAETGLLERWGEEGPPLLWDKAIGTGYGAPSVRGDRLVLHHRRGGEEIVECMDAATGETRWRHSYPSDFVDPYGYNNGPRCSPLLTEDRCYTFGAEGRLVCLELADGDLVWECDTSEEWDVPQPFFGVGSNPVLEGDLLIVMVGGQPNSGMVAFNAENGEVVWESVGEKNWQGEPMIGWRGERTVDWKPWHKQSSYASPVAATVHGQRRVFCLMRQGLVSLDPETGSVFDSYWFRAEVNSSVNAAQPVVVDDRVFISSAYYRTGSVLLEVESETDQFRKIWRNLVLEIHWSTPVYHDGYLYAFSGRNEPDARFRCVEYATGKLMWDRDESWRRVSRQPPHYGRGSLIRAEDKLIVVGEGGLLGLFELNPEEPVEICRYQVPQLRYPCWAGPVLSRKRLHLRSEDHLVCFDWKGRPDSAEAGATESGSKIEAE